MGSAASRAASTLKRSEWRGGIRPGLCEPTTRNGRLGFATGRGEGAFCACELEGEIGGLGVSCEFEGERAFGSANCRESERPKGDWAIRE
ncbi:hypothetical protein KFK09_006425 [Dendrobium nobile]|uniref:Uncharacterized protein n=1 Tax=Dendrobium nobile TaxID=94219 RepID=A0A8T3BS76_DENNO|nr:hypothetical protein KFK09_006425 [Dendrobium nobile]